jgi:hypothetical protein
MKLTLQQKHKIVELNKLGYTAPDISKELGVSIQVVHKWVQIEKKGLPLEPIKGRPKKGTMGSFDNKIHDKVDSYRSTIDGWGPTTIQVELKFEPPLNDMRLPSRSTIARYLKDKGITKSYRKQYELPIIPCFPPQFEHDVWQMDAEGNKQVDGLGTVCTINLKDTYTRTYVASLPLIFKSSSNHPKLHNYQTLLRIAFNEFGMNRRLQVDHEGVFYDNFSTSPFPTRIQLWLCGLGIELCFTPKAKPQKQGCVERSHQTMYRQVIAGQVFKDFGELFERCQKRRNRLNKDIPCSTIGGMPPFTAFPNAIRSKRPYIIQQEEELFDDKLVDQFLRKGKWYRKISCAKTIEIGGMKYHLSNGTAKQEVVITYNPYRRSFIFKDSTGKLINTRLVKGISYKELAGDPEEAIKIMVV